MQEESVCSSEAAVLGTPTPAGESDDTPKREFTVQIIHSIDEVRNLDVQAIRLLQ